MNTYQSQQFWNNVNSIIGFTMSIVVMSFLVGMVRPMGRFVEPPLKPEKHLPKPIVKEATVPGGVYWKCSTCGKDLPPGTKVFKAGKEVYCSIPCIRLPEHHSSGGNPMEIERYSGFMVRVGGVEVRSLNLPDWSLDYVEFPRGKMAEYRTALMQARMKIVKVTETRIYFEQV